MSENDGTETRVVTVRKEHYGKCVGCRLMYLVTEMVGVLFSQAPNDTPVPAYVCGPCRSGETNEVIRKGGG